MMKFSQTVVLIMFTAIAALVVNAQVPTPNAQGKSPTFNSIVVPDGNVAVIDSSSFGDQKTGITRLLNAYNILEREFKSQQDEIKALRTRYDLLLKQKNVTATVADQATQLENEIKKKQEQGQKAFDQRLKDLTDPIYADIGSELLSFAKKRGIKVIFDLSKMAEVMYITDDSINITVDFIKDYNLRHPGSAPIKP
jgi:Skp family chaperone for outer membrane proteins